MSLAASVDKGGHLGISWARVLLRDIKVQDHTSPTKYRQVGFPVFDVNDPSGFLPDKRVGRVRTPTQIHNNSKADLLVFPAALQQSSFCEDICLLTEEPLYRSEPNERQESPSLIRFA
eukprot:scaffold3821_cov173-Amphora_coffeaeformis.AAC.24